MNEKHDLKVEQLENYLEGKTIALCVTGGIAAIETPKIARHLRRYGAVVKAYVTPNALKFIGEASLEWATEKNVVCNLSGLAEHICLEDLVLVAPATLNTINKIMYGIADNTVTSLVASALGSKIPVYFAPCMHGSLYNNPFFQENLKKVDQYGIKIIEPRFSEGKAKIATVNTIVSSIINHYNPEVVLK
ncbi:Dihydromethanopterin reductase (acceptor) [uncultured archaeon]|nr:Dihydromethanopterin reductase (acceptor) [uncultured archaeon]